jgi:hypothetical protein
MGIAAQESGLGTFVRQKGGGPALGIFQMERPTFEWVHKKSIPKYPELARIGFVELEWNIDSAAIMCRHRLRIDQYPLPAFDDVPGQAAYWKRVWNTYAGAGTVEQYIVNFEQRVVEK